jgi:hypothetical protein
MVLAGTADLWCSLARSQVLCRYLEDEKAREADEAMVQKIVAMELRPGEEAELHAKIRAYEERAAAVQDCTQVHATIGRGTHSLTTAAHQLSEASLNAFDGLLLVFIIDNTLAWPCVSCTAAWVRKIFHRLGQFSTSCQFPMR